MRVESIETRLYRVPPTVRISDAIQSIHRWEWIITTLRTDTGLVGRGWTYTLGLLLSPDWDLRTQLATGARARRETLPRWGDAASAMATALTRFSTHGILQR